MTILTLTTLTRLFSLITNTNNGRLVLKQPLSAREGIISCSRANHCLNPRQPLPQLETARLCRFASLEGQRTIPYRPKSADLVTKFADFAYQFHRFWSDAIFFPIQSSYSGIQPPSPSHQGTLRTGSSLPASNWHL